MPTAEANRLIKLLMMLPSPNVEEFSHFWGIVANDLSVDRHYVTGKIAVHMKLIRDPEDRIGGHETGLAKYAFYFFGQPSEDVMRCIADSVDPGSANSAPGRAWVAELHTAAFAVLEANQTSEHVEQAAKSWVLHRWHRD